MMFLVRRKVSRAIFKNQDFFFWEQGSTFNVSKSDNQESEELSVRVYKKNIPASIECIDGTITKGL